MQRTSIFYINDIHTLSAFDYQYIFLKIMIYVLLFRPGWPLICFVDYDLHDKLQYWS